MCTFAHFHKCNICSRWHTHSHIGDLDLSTTPQKFQANSVQIWKWGEYLQKYHFLKQWYVGWPKIEFIEVHCTTTQFDLEIWKTLEEYVHNWMVGNSTTSWYLSMPDVLCRTSKKLWKVQHLYVKLKTHALILFPALSRTLLSTRLNCQLALGN